MRARRRRNGQARRARMPSLNLVSLMDIFTILVFFLMMNSSNVEVLQTDANIDLPDSTSEQRPESRLVISIDREDLVIQGRPVARMADLAGPADAPITVLRDELALLAERRGAVPEGGFEVSILGDQELPYWLLKRILLTCEATDFARVSLAVNQVEHEA